MPEPTTIPLPPCSYLNAILSYEPETGILRWKQQLGSLALIGKEAGCATKGGYRRIRICGVLYLAHRIIWKMQTGEEPKFIDHIDGIRENNRLSNLRSVANQENRKNKSKPRNNKSGVVGVSWFLLRSCWRAVIYINGKQIHLGLFDKFQDAVAARKAAERNYGFHSLHGKNIELYPKPASLDREIDNES